MKKSRKLFSVILLVFILMNMCLTASASETEIKVDQSMADEILVTERNGNEFEVPGIEYSSNMAVVTDKDQMKYTLKVNELSLHQGKIDFCAEIYDENHNLIKEISQVGDIFESTATSGKESGRITAMFEDAGDKVFKILNCSFESDPVVDLLFPANKDLANMPIMTFAVWINNGVLYFEGALPDNKIYTKIDDIAVNEDEVGALFKRRSAGAMFSSAVLSEAETREEVLEEVQASESWRAYLDPVTEDDVIMLDDEETIAKYFGRTSRATVSGIPDGMPVDVFQKLGSWGSVNNPNNQANGYVAITTRRGGTTNVNETKLFQWGYIFNKCGDFAKNVDVSSGGTIALQAKAVGRYVYYPDQNKIQYEGSADLKITDMAIAMGLRSGEQIITKTSEQIVAQGKSISINWKAVLGLIPNGYVQTAVKLFSLIEYKDSDNNPVNGKWDFPDTASLQIKNYGKPIRGRKLVHNGKELTTAGDQLRVEYTVKHPNDITRTSGTKYISNKYYFFVYGRDVWGAYTNKIKTVNEIRENSYTVYK